MYATVRRYEGIDKVRSEEITRKVGDRRGCRARATLADAPSEVGGRATKTVTKDQREFSREVFHESAAAC
jgi:hypothetical protein